MKPNRPGVSSRCISAWASCWSEEPWESSDWPKWRRVVVTKNSMQSSLVGKSVQGMPTPW